MFILQLHGQPGQSPEDLVVPCGPSEFCTWGGSLCCRNPPCLALTGFPGLGSFLVIQARELRGHGNSRAGAGQSTAAGLEEITQDVALAQAC